MKKRICRIIFASLLLSTIQSSSQEKNNIISIGERGQIRSSVLGETRDILLYAPDNVSQKLPLIIVFDAESLFGTVVSAVRFMNYSSEIPQMPEAIVVGITNTDRQRDMPIPQEFGAKGEDNFRKFLTDELIPFLKNKYPLNGHNIVVGHSQGGLFVSYLLEKSPEYFSWAVALDAPMTVDKRTDELKKSLSNRLHSPANKLRYASIETLYGWEDDWKKTGIDVEQSIQIKLPNESHESMPFKGIYDGLKFLYHDFQPSRKELALKEMQQHYRSLSEKYGYIYEIPLRVILSSVGRKMMEGRKTQITELLNYAEEKYGATDRTAKLKMEAAKLVAGPDTLIDHYLNLPKPSPEQVKKYLGRWMGTLTIRMGQDMPVDMEIIVENGKAKFINTQPWPPYNKEEPEIFSVTDDGKLIFGRRNRGSGLVISVAHLDKNGKLSGEENLVGFVIQDDFPADAKERMKFIIDNPNTFVLTKK